MRRCLPLQQATVSLNVPARAGDAEVDIETPALVVDLDAFDANIQLASDLLKAHPEVHCYDFMNNRVWEWRERRVCG